MAKRDKLDYDKTLKELRAEGPKRLYLLWGEEDYLRESFFSELKKLCLGDGGAEFNHRRFDSETLAAKELEEAVDTLPFLGERTLVELRGFAPDKHSGEAAERIKELFSSIPEFCTLAILPGAGYQPDKRLSLYKAAVKHGSVLEFTSQDESSLVNWIGRRFKALGKTISRRDAERLIFLTGGLMNRLISEIEKAAAHCEGEIVTGADLDAVVDRRPEADVFEMTDCLAVGDFDSAARLLSGLLFKREHPTMILAVIGMQFSRLYAARLALENGLGADYVMEACKIRYDFIVRKLLGTAKAYDIGTLREILALCAEADYRMKTSSSDDEGILTELILRIASPGISVRPGG